MKKLIALTLALITVFVFASCGSEGGNDEGHTHDPSGAPVTSVKDYETGVKDVFSADEDAAYHDLFYNDAGDKYENKEFTKNGVFAVIYDAYNDVERYYVWGYGDEAKDCCYQWEFVMPENATVPAPGSYIKVTGTMSHDEKALDKYWLTDVTFSVEEAYEATEYDFDFVTMSPTLIRVQMINMLQLKEEFADKRIRIIGKALSENTLGSANDSSEWSVHFSAANGHIHAGDNIMIDGIFNKGGEGAIITASDITVID